MTKRWRTTWLSIALAAGCSSGPVIPVNERAAIAPSAVGSTQSGAHIMPVRRPGEGALPPVLAAAPAGAHLAYYGGPVVGKIKVVTVFWGANVQQQSQLNSFYSAVTNSAYFDWLKEYNTATQVITRGALVSTLADGGAPAKTALTDADVQAELSKLVDGGKLPKPDASVVYMVHFPPGVSINLDGALSCQVFCAYHSTYAHDGVNIRYGVIPDQGGLCAGGCGNDLQPFNNLTAVSSHELIEAVTDPDVGLASVIGAPLAWYDPTNGEIGDLCNGQQGSAAGFTVQLAWSNSQGACIDHLGTCVPSCGARACGPDGCGSLCGICPTGQACVVGGVCSSACAPQCSGKACGPDGCGGTCGICSAGQSCNPAGHCQAACTPSCSGRSCGPDGCGGTCGACAGGQTCSASGVCQGPANACPHPLCSTGAVLPSGCDGCVATICAQDSFCCGSAWDSICVSEVTSVCGRQCGGARCLHPLCSTGTALTTACDPCAARVCAQDSFCCTTSWDTICVSEVRSLCGQTCG